MKINLSCLCGAHWSGDIHEDAARAVQDEWDSRHTGPGHAPCSPQTASAARRKAEGVGHD